MTIWDALETPLTQEPLFWVQAPDGRRDWPEIDRQATLFRIMRVAAPSVVIEANANAGKRNPAKARKEGIRAGVFDVSVRFGAPLAAWIEMKGYDSRSRAGSLSANQIEWGNRQTKLGWPVACFFCPYAAPDWFRDQGFPIAKIARAA